MTEQERLSAFLNSHQDEIINWVSSKVITQFKDKGDTFNVGYFFGCKDVTCNKENKGEPRNTWYSLQRDNISGVCQDLNRGSNNKYH